MLHHSFPGFLSESRKNVKNVKTEDYLNVGAAILRSILRHGLLLVPEDLSLRPSPYTSRADKRELIQKGEPMLILRQKRACFTLSTAGGLFERREGISEHRSHAELFGQFSIGVDPVHASTLGILPVIHYYDYLPGGADEVRNAVSPYLVDRLVEIRNLLSILSHIKATAHPELPYALTREILCDMHVEPYNEDEIVSLLDKLDKRTARSVFKLFATDRVPMWNLVESVDMLLALFQTTHSRSRNRHLAYYEQREWRLIQHGTQSHSTYSLGERSWIDSPDNEETVKKKKVFVQSIKDVLYYSPWLKESLSESWVLESTGGLPFRDYVGEIVVPQVSAPPVRKLLQEIFPQKHIVWKMSSLPSTSDHVVFYKTQYTSAT